MASFGGQGGKVEGPRLGDLQVQASTYGMGIPEIYGSMRIAGNVIWAKPLIEKRQKESAGKDGGGPAVISYSYFATFAVALLMGQSARSVGSGRTASCWSISPKRRRRVRPTAMTSGSTVSISAPRIKSPIQ